MKNASIAAVLAGVAILLDGRVFAQDMEFELEESETPTEEGTGEEGTGEEATGEGTGEGTEGEGDVIGDLAGGGEEVQRREAAPRAEVAAEEEIYAVQQIYALRINRVELTPSLAFTINDPYVSRRGFGIGLNYWWTNVLALGANFIWYQGFESESDLNFFVRRSTRLAVPITEWQMGAHLNFTYVPIYGKFMMFNKFIFQWDTYIIGGVGFQRTRPIAVIDPEVRDFNYGIQVAFNVGIGIRIFLTRWLSFFTEFRNYMYLERLENLEVALGGQRQDSATWFQDGREFVNNVTAHIGISIFFPFEFDYELPK
jgi:outer membrane beta-barrel protein